jgi:hypothetical protein
MATEPSKADTDKLDAKIKELMKRGQTLDVSIGQLHDAAEEAKSAAAVKSKEVDALNKKGAALDKTAAKYAKK